MFSKKGYKRLQNHLDLLDEHPAEGWAAYGDDVCFLVENMWLTLCEIRHNRRRLLGKMGNSRTTNIYNPRLQQQLRREKYLASPYCEAPDWTNCPMKGRELVWDASQLDHIIPVIEGGETTHENTRLLCANCHRIISAKSNRGNARYNTLGQYVGP